MDEFPKSKYYLVKIFRKTPDPFLLWPLLITIVFLIGDYLTYPSFRLDLGLDSVHLLIANTFFSISALFLIVITYEKNIAAIQNWIKMNEFTDSNEEDVINKLNKSHNVLFPLIFLSAFLVICFRVLIAYKLHISRDILGGIVNDTITQFLISSLILSSVGNIVCIYITSSYGIKVKSQLKIKPAYEYLYSHIIKNTFMIGIQLGIFSSGVLYWATKYQQGFLGFLCDFLILGSIPFIFLIGVAGIRNGIISSKNNLLSPLLSEMNNYDILENKKNLSLFDANLIVSIYDKLSNKAKEITEINPWMFDVISIVHIGFTLITSKAISSIVTFLLNYLST